MSINNTLVILCDRQNDHESLRKFIHDKNVEDLNVYRRPGGILEFSVTYKDDESARTAKNKLERLAAEYWDYSITVSQPEAVRTSGTETEPSNLPAIKAPGPLRHPLPQMQKGEQRPSHYLTDTGERLD